MGGTIQFDGTPYFVLGQKIFEFRNGKDRKEAWKQKRKELVEKVRFCISLRQIYFHSFIVIIRQYYHPLLHCLHQGRMSPFPLTTTKHDRCKTKDVAIILYCSCRMPWQKADDSDPAMQMAQCDNCLEWFHRCCENIPNNIFVNDSFWECYKCQKKVKIPAHVNSM